MSRLGATHHKWTADQSDWLIRNYRQIGWDGITKSFNRKFNLSLSRGSVLNKIWALGIQGQEDDTRYTVQEVIDMIGICPVALRKKIRIGTVKASKVLGKWLISADELDRLAEWFRTDTPWPAIASGDAAKRLSYTVGNMGFLIHRGSLSAVKRGAIWMVKLSEIEAAEQYMKRTGHVRVPWAKLKQQAEKNLT